ncbi:TorD/DmsD family molecular chaperone [Amycolatopsis keratiniphila]|uniref:TorD/DmsD family molecular chaperone n=1 Tax=Amycolatopsis keratiniphila TaxID=129921 RepID=UPI000907931F|nr:molecular chaperone TorD family protein [Amycolatopsis keratiniphila]OLZ50167.1 hypothetical protein BS330_29295 [Amycolatopsis keratiniphila subsp. nogabecina]
MSIPPAHATHLDAYAGVFRLAARLFAYEIDADLYHAMARNPITTETGILAAPASITQSEAEVLEDMAAEFCRLFIGPQPECPPYASAHAGEVKLGGQAARRIDEFMARHGVHPEIGHQPAVLEHDHLSVELALLAHFCELAASNSSHDSLGAARELVLDHLWPWADGYLDNLAALARHSPYGALAGLVRDVLYDALTQLDRPTNTSKGAFSGWTSASRGTPQCPEPRLALLVAASGCSRASGGGAGR